MQTTYTSSVSSKDHLTRFLKATHANWRDSVYLECGHCERACAKRCHDLLFAIDESGTPIIIPVQDAATLWDEEILKDECLDVMKLSLFHEQYKNWILAHVYDPFLCPMTDIHLEVDPAQSEKMSTFVNL